MKIGISIMSLNTVALGKLVDQEKWPEIKTMLTEWVETGVTEEQKGDAFVNFAVEQAKKFGDFDEKYRARIKKLNEVICSIN